MCSEVSVIRENQLLSCQSVKLSMTCLFRRQPPSRNHQGGISPQSSPNLLKEQRDKLSNSSLQPLKALNTPEDGLITDINRLLFLSKISSFLKDSLHV